MGPEGLPVQAKRLNTTGSPRGLGFPHYSWKSGCEGWLARSSSTRWGGGRGVLPQGKVPRGKMVNPGALLQAPTSSAMTFCQRRLSSGVRRLEGSDSAPQVCRAGCPLL